MEEKIDFNIFSDSTEKLEETYLDNAKRFNNLNSDWLQVESNYEDHLWRFRDLNQNHASNMLFILPKNLRTNPKYNNLIKSLKSWVIYHLEQQYNIQNINTLLSIISNAIETSYFFDVNQIEQFEKKFFNDKYHKHYNSFKAAKIIQFNDFSNIDIPNEFMEVIFNKYYEGANVKNGMRELPSCKDALKFSLIIDDYFGSINEKEFLNYFPIYFWWKFTNIIPMRINEFCLIKRDALKMVKGTFFIEIPRSKGNMNRTIRYEKIKITSELAKKIQFYLDLTKDISNSVTLINYDTLYQLREKSSSKNNNPEYFNKGNFTVLLKNFHTNIVYERYGFKLKNDLIENQNNNLNKYISKQFKPNDTRYFALFNLMLQGYHPSEIEKLAGHKDIYSQYSYHQHIKYWTDSDLFNLYLSNNKHLELISDNFFKQSFFKEKVLLSELSNEEVRIPLSIGYCTDPNQNCMVSEHYLCDHWRITREDYYKNQDVLNKMIQTKESNFKLLIDKLLDLHKTSIFKNQDYKYAGNNPDYLYKLKENANEISDSLFKLSKLKDKLNIYEEQR